MKDLNQYRVVFFVHAIISTNRKKKNNKNIIRHLSRLKLDEI